MQYFTVLVYCVGGGSYGTDDKNVRMGRAADRAQFPPIASVAVQVSLHSVTMWRGLVNATILELYHIIPEFYPSMPEFQPDILYLV